MCAHAHTAAQLQNSAAPAFFLSARRDCTCCKGFVHGCPTKICRSLGMCACAYEDDSLAAGEGLPGGSSRVFCNESAVATCSLQLFPLYSLLHVQELKAAAHISSREAL